MNRLVRRAAEALEDGPVHTLELAREVLKLSGHDGAASAAVFALLGEDDRFRVDERGVWRIAGAGGPHPAGFEEARFAVVDVETTGGSYTSGHRITEVAVVEVRGAVVGEVYDTLVHPGRRIPPRIARLTGITDRMVAAAPRFDHVADRVLDRLRGRVFVAHNVRFDWGFLRAQLAEAVGEAPEGPRLCTLRMARRLLPDVRRRNLDALARHFRVEIADRHRARGDAVATARILLRLLDEARERGLRTLPTLLEACGRRGASSGASGSAHAG